MAADWSRSETISSPDEIVIEYSTTNAQGQSEKKEVVLISTPRSLNTIYHAPVTYTDAEGKQQTREVITRKVDERRTTVAAVNPAYIVWRLSQGLGLPVGDVFNITETTYEYVVSTEGPRVVREQVSDYMTEWQLAGSLAIEKYNNYEPTADRFECNRTVTFYDEWTGPYGRAVTRRRISRWASLGLSQEGSQAVQRKLKSIKSFLSAAQDLTGANLEAVVNSSKRLIFEGTEVQIETGKLPVPEMPSAADVIADEIVNGSDTTDTDGNGIPDWAQYDPADPFDVDNNGDGISDWVDLESLYEPDDNERRTNNDFTFDDQVSQQALDFDPATGLPIDPISGLPVKAISNFEIKPVGDFQVDQSGRLINPATGQPYNPPITVAIDPVTGQPADPNVGFAINPATGQPYNPPITVALDPVTGQPADTGLGLLIDPATGDIFNPPRFTRVDPDSGLPIFAGDSVTATYEMPFAPDDTIEFVDGVRTLVPGGSEDAAELFGEVEASLDYGHAYGQNIVTAFGEMPSLTLAPIYIQLAGVEGAFLMDSVTYAWGSDGMVVSSDLMLLGVTGRYGSTTPSASWLRVPVPVASLRQINTAGTIEASPQKANTIAIPGGFNARNPAATLAALPTNGTDVFREWRDGDQLTQPVIKIKRSKLFTKPTLKAKEFPYSLIPSSESAVLMTQPVLDFVWMIGVAPPSATVAVAAFAPSIRTGASVKPPAAVVSVAGRAPIASNATVVAVPAALIVVAGRAPDQVGRPRTEINAPSAIVALAASPPVVASQVNVIVPAVAVAVAGVVPTVQTTPTDPSFSSVSLLLHMNGANGSTTFIDSSATPMSISANGNARISTTQSRFGGAAGYFDGSGDYLSAPFNSDIDLIGSSFTVECWIYPEVSKFSGARIASAGGGFAGWNSSNGIHWLLQLSHASPQPIISFQLYTSTGPAGLSTSEAAVLNTWTHVAVCVSGSTGYLFVNGVGISASLGTLQRPSTNPLFEIASIPGQSGASSNAFQGFIDEFRITKGVARYTANFTPPTAPFPDS